MMCPTCAGNGEVEVPLWQDRFSGVWETDTAQCASCDGTGTVVTCPGYPVLATDGKPIAGCGKLTPDIRDDEGWVDCQHCGLFFNPDHEENQP